VTSEAGFVRPPVWRPPSRRNSGSKPKSGKGPLGCSTSTRTSLSSTPIGERAVVCRRTRRSCRGFVTSTHLPVGRRKGRPPERAKPRRHLEASAAAAEGRSSKLLVTAAMMAVAVELMMMKVALEGCPVLQQPDLATNRVALARLLEEHYRIRGAAPKQRDRLKGAS
jgi:hypothetical protein